jgi:hypothetical protein
MVLYDVFWGAAAASIRLYSDQEKERKVSIQLDNLQRRSDDLRALRTFRETMFESMYSVQKSQDAEWYATATDSVVDGLLPLCFQNECGCFKEVFILRDEHVRSATYYWSINLYLLTQHDDRRHSRVSLPWRASNAPLS